MISLSDLDSWESDEVMEKLKEHKKEEEDSFQDCFNSNPDNCAPEFLQLLADHFLS